MLSKLIKHDFRALSRTLAPMQLGIIAAAALCTVLMAVNVRVFSTESFDTVRSSMGSTILMMVTILTTVLVALAIAASALVTVLLVAMYFYKNFLGDEGYLTFTLPTTTGRLLWSKLITGFAWILINLGVIAASVTIFSVFGTSSQSLVNNGVFQLIEALAASLRDVFTGATAWVIIESLLCGIVVAGYQLMKIYFAVIIGGQVAQKHKLLASIGMYLAIDAAVSVLTSVFTAIFAFSATGLSLLSGSTATGAMDTVIWYNTILSLALGTLFFLISRNVLKNHLNLQ